MFFLRTLTEKRLPLYIEETKMRRNKKCVQPLKIRGFGLYVKKYKKIKKRLALLPWIRYTKRAVT